VFAALLAMATFLGAYTVLKPRLTISTSGPSDDRNPLSASFLVSNDGYLPLYAVSIHCVVAEIDMNRTPTEGGTPVAISIGANWEKERIFNVGDKVTIPLSDCLIIPTQSLPDARVGLQATYRPIWSPSQRKRVVIYTARSIGLGRFYWEAMPSP